MAEPQSLLQVRGACEHNLRSLDVAIDRGCITVITGVSGSGKSSLAFDTVLAEAQRRFFNTLSHYSRQFLDLGSRPSVRHISGLSPAIALAQNETLPSRRATVGTLTDISELLGVVLASFGMQTCPRHGLPTASQSVDQITERILTNSSGKTVAICVPLAESKKGSFRAPLTSFAEKGFLRAFIDGRLAALSPLPKLAREEKHTIKIIMDYVKVKAGGRDRLERSLETALLEGAGYGEYFPADSRGEIEIAHGFSFSTVGGCPECGYSWPRLDSRYFSINSLGKCSQCQGFGLADGCDTDDEDDGESGEEETGKGGLDQLCSACDGTGLDARFAAVTLNGKSPHQLHGMPLADLLGFLVDFAEHRVGSNPAFERVAVELQGMLRRVVDVGLGYLTISRRVRTLSGGEAQRLRLAGILAENLRGVLYILDEPSQGLHNAEIDILWSSLARLRDMGNTIIVVDHDETLMRRADWIIDLGPGGGLHGGRLMAKFHPSDASQFMRQSRTAECLVKTVRGPAEKKSQRSFDSFIEVHDACLHNLNVPLVKIPLGGLSVVTGVSGAGKSSLILSTLYANLLPCFEGRGSAKPRQGWRFCSAISGFGDLEGMWLINRRPIAKSAVSMPASYLGIFTDLRDLYASLPAAQIAGLTARDFSLSVEGGRCSECKGRGQVTLSMRFLADARVRCPVCKGARYRPHILDVRYDGLSMVDVLNLTLEEVTQRFKNHRRIIRRLQPACELGLGYLKLGQTSASLSGGESQRLKLVPFLSQSRAPSSLVILDEPTTGLHFEDVSRLLKVLGKMSSQGATVILIEHNTDVIMASDWVIDLGPGAAAEGGRLLYQGPPEAFADVEASITARYLPMEERH